MDRVEWIVQRLSCNKAHRMHRKASEVVMTYHIRMAPPEGTPE